MLVWDQTQAQQSKEIVHKKFNKRPAHLPTLSDCPCPIFLANSPSSASPCLCSRVFGLLLFMSFLFSQADLIHSYGFMYDRSASDFQIWMTPVPSLSQNSISISPPDTFTWICSRCQLVWKWSCYSPPNLCPKPLPFPGCPFFSEDPTIHLAAQDKNLSRPRLSTPTSCRSSDIPSTFDSFPFLVYFTIIAGLTWGLIISPLAERYNFLTSLPAFSLLLFWDPFSTRWRF